MNRDNNQLSRLERQVESISERLERLSVERQELREALDTTVNELRQLRRHQRTNRTNRNHHTNTRRRSAQGTGELPEQHYDETLRPRLGDQVRIINPKADQPTIGVVQGFCVDGKLKIFREGHIVVTRLPKNVALISRHE